MNRVVHRARVSAGLLIIVVVALATVVAGATARPAKELNGVTVIRDGAGVPHITATSFRALGYGEGYAFAQDNLCTFADDVVTVNGQRSQYFGPNGNAVNYSAGVSNTNLNSDLYWRYVKASGIVNRWLHGTGSDALLPQVKDVYTGYTQGYNAFLRSGKLHDPRCQGKPWVRTITLTDLLLRGEQIATEASAQQFIGGIVPAAPPKAAARDARDRVTAAPDVKALQTQFGDNADGALGSNGIGLGSAGTQSGQGMVLANPHFPWRGTERFWMAQLNVPGSYNVEGGTLEGFPLIGIGFNRHIAWTHTVSTSRRFVLYQLNLVRGNATSYVVDGKIVPMSRTTVSVHYGSTTVSHTFYSTRWGLVTTVPPAHYGWDNTHAYALYDATAPDGPRAANQYFRMGQARSVHDLYNVEAKFLAIPTFNTVAADDGGNAFYGDVGDTPNVTQPEIKTCTPVGLPQIVFAQARIVTLDGSKTSCSPATDPGTPVPGIFDGSHLPHMFRRDYVENSNDSYWLANPSAPMTGYSPVIGLTGTQQGLRTRLGNEMIAQRIAGTDGYGAAKFTIHTLQKMWGNDRSKLAELVLGALVADCRAHPSAKATNGQTVVLTGACQALSEYGPARTGAISARAAWLFSEWNVKFTQGNFWAKPFDPAAPLTTPSGLDTSNPETLTALADAVLELQGQNVKLDAPLGDVQHVARGSQSIPIHGCDTGCFNAIYASNGLSASPTSQAPYGEVYTGSSLVMTTQLNRSGPSSQGILTYSQATDPTSPWFANMTRLYSQRKWVKLPYAEKDLVQAKPLRTSFFLVK